LITWWDKANKEAKELEKIPVLIIKQNNKPILWISNLEFRDKMTFFFSYQPKVQINHEGDALCVYLFDKIKELSPNVFKAMLEEIMIDGDIR